MVSLGRNEIYTFLGYSISSWTIFGRTLDLNLEIDVLSFSSDFRVSECTELLRG